MRDQAHDPWNRVRLEPGSRAGHVESYFVKACDPLGEGRAVWVRFTLLAPRGRPRDAVAEVWAVVFDRALGRPVALKRTWPLAEARIDPSRPRIEVGSPQPERSGKGSLSPGQSCHLEPGWTRGRLEGARGRAIAWDLRWPRPGAGPGRALPLYPSRALYETPFPATKLVSPEPDAPFAGTVTVEEEGRPQRRQELLGWPGMQGHNWGRRHALRYAWAHASAFPGAPGAVLEAASASVPLGPLPLPSPLLTVALARLPGGAEVDMRGPARWWNPTAVLEAGPGAIRYLFAAEGPAARLTASLEAPLEETALLRYEDPDGAVAWCRNAKTARVTLDVAVRPGGGGALETVARLSGTGALEVLTREADPGREVDA